MNSRIEREKKTVRKMIAIYCRHNLGTSHLPAQYQQLADYACQRLDKCKFGERKPSCKRCKIHCYTPEKRRLIRQVMKWSGPRIFFYAPMDAIRHLFSR